MNQDAEHLNLLSIFHYVLAGITGLCACFPVFHLAMGIMFLTQPEFLEPEQDVPPEMPMVFGLLFTIIVLVRPSVKTLFEEPAGDPFGG